MKKFWINYWFIISAINSCVSLRNPIITALDNVCNFLHSIRIQSHSKAIRRSIAFAVKYYFFCLNDSFAYKSIAIDIDFKALIGL